MRTAYSGNVLVGLLSEQLRRELGVVEQRMHLLHICHCDVLPARMREHEGHLSLGPDSTASPATLETDMRLLVPPSLRQWSLASGRIVPACVRRQEGQGYELRQAVAAPATAQVGKGGGHAPHLPALLARTCAGVSSCTACRREALSPIWPSLASAASCMPMPSTCAAVPSFRCHASSNCNLVLELPLSAAECTTHATA